MLGDTRTIACASEACIAKAREAKQHHRPGRWLGNRPEGGHVAVNSEPECAKTARAGDLDEVSSGRLKVPERSERTDDRRLAARGRG